MIGTTLIAVVGYGLTLVFVAISGRHGWAYLREPNGPSSSNDLCALFCAPVIAVGAAVGTRWLTGI